jgi:hypothetical protein
MLFKKQRLDLCFRTYFVCLLVVTDLVIVTVKEPPSKLVRSVISVSEKPYFVNQTIIAIFKQFCYKMHNFKAVDHKKKIVLQSYDLLSRLLCFKRKLSN